MSVDGEFKRLTAKDRLCVAVLKAVRENDTAALRRLGLGGFAQYAGRLSELMTASVREGLDWSPDFAALMRQVNSPVRYAHHLVNECGTAVQTALDERNGLRLRVVQPEYNDGRTKAIVGEAAESDSEHAADNLATQLGTEVKDAGNEFMKQNAEQRSRAGFKVTVERTGGTNCCPWCADRIGRWELKDAPKDVFGVHDNCKCMVDYTNSRGVKQRGLASTIHKASGEKIVKWEWKKVEPEGLFKLPKILTKTPKNDKIKDNVEKALKVQKGQPVSIDNAVVLANPKWKTDIKYQKNCQRCVQAYEFLRRGYPVEALPRPHKRDNITWGNECFIDFQTVAGKKADTLFEWRLTDKDIFDRLSQAPEGSRHVIYCQWKRRGAHVFIAEVENGTVRYVDPQSGEKDCSAHFGKARNGKFGIFRIDDKPITDNAKVIKKTVTKGAGVT